MYNIKENELRMVKRLIRSVFVVLVMLALVGCGGAGSALNIGGTVRYINPDANFSYIKKVAVLPFNNLTSDRYAGEKVRGAVTVDLMSRGVFDVIEQGEVSKVLNMLLRAAGVSAGSVMEADFETLKLLGERLEVQAVLMGSVYEYESQRGSSVVSLAIRLIDTSSGTVLWTAKSDVSGSTMWRKMIGIEEADTTVLGRRAVKNALDTLL